MSSCTSRCVNFRTSLALLACISVHFNIAIVSCHKQRLQQQVSSRIYLFHNCAGCTLVCSRSTTGLRYTVKILLFLLNGNARVTQRTLKLNLT